MTRFDSNSVFTSNLLDDTYYTIFIKYVYYDD